jgi:phosphinothricin acetyltransferase
LIAGLSSANPGAVRFHERAGFALAGRLHEVGQKDGQWLDLVFMEKALRP